MSDSDLVVRLRRRAALARGENTIGVDDILFQEASDRIEKLEAALRQIASCEKRADGDIVDIARKALK